LILRPSLLLNCYVSVLMAWNTSFEYQKIFLGNHLQYHQVLDGHSFAAHSTGHFHSFEYTRGIGSRTDGPRGPQSVVLSMGGLSDPSETVAFDNPLKSFAL